MLKIVTFIIPAYNAEKYLEKCLKSFLSPEINETIDVLIINDGSGDRTSMIAHEFAEKYPGIFRVIDKANGGHGSTINIGAEKALGKYIKVIDSDDWVETENLIKYVESLKESEADVILTHYYTFDINTCKKQQHKVYDEDFNSTKSLKDIMGQFDKYDDCLCFHGITYNTKFYRSCGINLSEHVFYEDNEYATFPYYKAETICSLDLFLYVYRVGDVSQSVSVESRIKKIDHERKVASSMIDFYYSHKMSEAAKDYFCVKITRVLASYWITCFLCIPDRKEGRRLGKTMYKQLEDKDEIRDALKKKYITLLFMGYLHLDKKCLDRMIEFAKKRRQR